MPMRIQEDDARVEEGERVVNRWTATRRMEAANIMLCMRTIMPDEDCNRDDKKEQQQQQQQQQNTTENNTLG